MAYSFGDIYFVEFIPSVGHEFSGKRPALVVQEESISKISPLVTLLPFTSNIGNLMKDDVFIEKDRLNNLSEDSVIKVRNIQSFDRKRILFKIGRAGSPTIRQVRGYLRRHFGF